MALRRQFKDARTVSATACRVLAIAAMVWCTPASASAATLAPIPFRTLVGEATTVVYGRVSTVRGEWTPDRQGIESIVALDTLQVLKGRAGSRVTFKAPGGEAGGRIQFLPGMPSFREGDLVLVFLRGGGPVYPTLVGLTQGVFRVAVSPATGLSMVVAPPVETAHQPAGRIARGDRARRPVSLDAFSAEVRAAMEAGR
jgi:hypothetical protein